MKTFRNEIIADREARWETQALASVVETIFVGLPVSRYTPQPGEESSIVRAISVADIADGQIVPIENVSRVRVRNADLERFRLQSDDVVISCRGTVRSKSPALVRQELWASMHLYNSVRLEMAAVAKVLSVPPNRISFVASFHLIRDEWLWDAVAKPGAIPRHLTRLRESLKRYLLPPRRSDRSYPRAVKIKMSNYERKRPVGSAN